MNAVPLTKRQKEILGYLTEYIAQRGYAPSMEEIAQYLGVSSLNGVYKHLNALEERGFIRRLSNQARSIQILDPEEGLRRHLPLLGYVAAGQPIEAVSNPDEIDVPESFLSRGRSFVLQVTGDSMIEEHIQDGDLVVVEERTEARNGEMVVALVDGEEVTLKKYFREGGTVRLQPANAALAPIILAADRVRVQGVVTGVMRRY